VKFFYTEYKNKIKV